ncbi:MAG: serine/threonine protein kinase [Deltaproteobacteria bacterium]|nr:serine/threonine protein kinase [Deltaproteobacteria bacterium]
MGSVFLAEKISTGEPFAIKFLRQDCMDDPSYFARFEREVSALRSIRHPNVVNVYGWSIPQDVDGDDRPYVIMEHLEGEGLDKVLARAKKLQPLAAVRIMLQVLDGLAAAHVIGVVHRDLGPSNVFLIPRQRGRFHVKVLDFGLARSLHVAEAQSELTQQGTLMGKPAYVAPEALTGQAVDGRSDIFGCGVLLFRMLTGAFPYKESDSHLLWVERLRDARSATEYCAPSSVDPAVLPALDRIVQRAMRVKVEDRYATVEQMQEELLDVETALVGDASSRGDWSSSHPGIPTLGEVSSSVGLPRRGALSGPDATPTAGGVAPQVTKGPTGAERRRKLWLVGGAAATLVLVLVVVALFLRGGGNHDAAADAGASEVLLAAGGPDATGAAEELDVFEAKPDEATAEAAEEPDATAVKVVEAEAAEPEVVDAAPPQVVLVVKGLPVNAVARFGDVTLTGSPPSGLVPAEVERELVVEARGYETYREKLTLTGDRELPVRMQRDRRPPPPPRDGGRVVPGVPEDPF